MDNSPVLFLQCDWDTVLRKAGGQVWVFAKFKDQPSIQGTIKSVALSVGKISLVVTEGFQVELLSSKLIKVCLSKYHHSTLFLAPIQNYSSIHTKSVVSLSVTSAGLAVSASTEKNLIIWDTITGDLKRKLKGHLSELYKCRFFPSEQVVLSCGADMQIKIWSADTGVCPVTLAGHTMAITDVAIVDRGKNIVSVSKDGTAKLWHCGEARCIGNIVKVTSPINCCTIYKASSTLDLKEPQIVYSDKETNTDKKVLLLGCEDGSVYFIGLRSRQILFILEHESAVNSIAFLNPEQFIVGCQNGKICHYNINHVPKPVNVWSESNSAVLCLVECAEKGFFSSRADGSVVFRSTVSNGKYLALSGPNYDPVYDISCYGNILFTCCRDAVIRKYIIDPEMYYIYNSVDC